MALLEVDDIAASYGNSQVLFHMGLKIEEGEFVTLLGRNGMGKTTTVKTIMGLMSPTRGTIRFNGKPIHKEPSYRVARFGVGLVPEGRHIFPNLSVHENLVATAHNGLKQANPWTVERVYQLFPRLQERQKNLGAHLSGGEQQMLAISRALLTNPKLIILDEATEGLAPLIRAEIWSCLQTLKNEGLSILCIDKNLGPLLRTADRHYIIEKGQIAWNGTSDAFRRDADSLRGYLSAA